MKVHFLFSRRNKIFSRLIAWTSGLLIKDLERVPSHVAILLDFEELTESFVVESVLEAGVRIIPYSIWKSKNEECYSIPCPTNLRLNEVFSSLANIWDKRYDWRGISYFALCFLRHFLFKTPFPKINKWQSGDMFFCTEAAASLMGYGRYSMATPAKMCSDLLKNQ